MFIFHCWSLSVSIRQGEIQNILLLFNVSKLVPNIRKLLSSETLSIYSVILVILKVLSQRLHAWLCFVPLASERVERAPLICTIWWHDWHRPRRLSEARYCPRGKRTSHVGQRVHDHELSISKYFKWCWFFCVSPMLLSLVIWNNTTSYSCSNRAW